MECFVCCHTVGSSSVWVVFRRLAHERGDVFGEFSVGGGATPQRFCGSLRREGSFRERCAGESPVTVFWWLALAGKQVLGVTCWWELNRGGSVACFAEMAVFGSCVLMGAKSRQCFGRSLWRENSFGEACVVGSLGAVLWWRAW